MDWDDNKKKFQNAKEMHRWHPAETQYPGQLTMTLRKFITEECLNGH